MDYTYEYNGETYQITLEPEGEGYFRATMGEDEYLFSVIQLRDGGFKLIFPEDSVNVHTISEGNNHYVYDGTHQHQLTVPEKRAGRQRKSAGSGDLTAQMPGQVVEVLVNDGDKVEQGQTLVILEAMKMEIRVSAPDDGVVQQVLVQQGELVDRGQLLIQI